MPVEKSRFLKGLETVKIIVQIVAIVVAGFWTYMKFIRTEAPLFEITARVDRSLGKLVTLEDDCLRNFTITLVNSGKKAFEVKKVVTRAWKFYPKRDKDAFAELIDLDQIKAQGEVVLKKEFPDPAFDDKAEWYPFLQKYRPGEIYEHSFEVLFKRDEAAWVYLQTEISIDGETKPKVGGMWARICD